MPGQVPEDESGWWCDPASEYAFLGFSYEVTACQGPKQLKTEFTNIRNKYKGRYIRLYGVCDKKGYYNDVIDAAWEAGLGVHALVWFGFDGDDRWIGRRDELRNILLSNPKAKFVTRAVQFGSEPLFDGVLPAKELAKQVAEMRESLKSVNVPVTISEMAYGFTKQSKNDMKVIMDAIDPIDAHMLPFFWHDASNAKASWTGIEKEINTFWVPNAKGKKIYLTENGWLSGVHGESQKSNSGAAQASVQQQQDYFDMLDSKCEFFKGVAGGGVGWFAHIYSDNQEPGYGILGQDGKEKFPFSPRTHC
ncbi:glycoside hydrolase superfamily [Earliella scabrosa]|nr:glycoside hydrolase superfamily [Earliella scabrosa]